MNNYYVRLMIRILLLVLVSIATGVLIAYELYWIALVFLLINVVLSYLLYNFSKRANVDAGRLADAIRIGEFNVSFKYSESKGLHPDIASKMKKSVELLGEKMKEIKTEQFFYDILLSRIDTPILLVDAKDRITWINKSATDIFGVNNPKQLDDLAVKHSQLSTLLRELKIREIKTIRLTGNKKDTVLAATASSITLRGDEQKLISLKDIQKPLEENELEAWKKLLRILTHEIMNSLTPIISLAETFSDDHASYDTQTKDKAMQTIFRRSKGLIEFVGNYQQLTRIPLPHKNNIQANLLLESIHHLLQANNILFTYTITPHDLQIHADEGQLEQVLINVIKNAWEATSQDVHAKVDVLITLDDYQRVLILVSDNGCGLSPSIYDNVFIPFYTTKQAGSGIGLSICKQIIANHGGNISLDSTEGLGCKVTISL